MSEQPPYAAFVQQPASAPYSGGSSRRHDVCDLLELQSQLAAAKEDDRMRDEQIAA
jgi:hypothetical protein